MIKIDNCDIYELGATDNEEKLVISDFVVEITKYPDNIQQGVSALRGRVLKIYPKTIDAQTLRQTHEYEIRNKDELSAYRFQLSQFGIPIEHGADFTAVIDRQLLCPVYRQLGWPVFFFFRSIFSSAVFRL